MKVGIITAGCEGENMYNKISKRFIMLSLLGGASINTSSIQGFRRSRLLPIILVILLLASSVAIAFGATASLNYRQPLDVISSGGGAATSAGYINNGTLGQSSPIGISQVAGSQSNNGGFWAAAPFDLNIVGPDVTIDSTTPSTTPTNSATMSIAFSSSDTSATFECNFNSGGFSSCSSPFDQSGLGAGSYTFEVRAINALVPGSPATYAWDVDLTNPTLSPVSLATNNASGTWAKAGDTITLSMTASEAITTPIVSIASSAGVVSGSSTTWSATYIVQSTDVQGAAAISISGFNDLAGNPGSTVTATTDASSVAIDTVAPDTSITAQPANPATTTSASFTFSGNDGTGSGVASFKCQLDSAGFGPCTSPQAYSSLGQGSHTFDVRATDISGNTDTTPASYTWTVDTIPPTDGTLTPTLGNGQVVLNWTAATDTGSGLQTANTYKLVRNARTVAEIPNLPAAQCTSGTQVYLGILLTVIDLSVTNDTTYDYRLCAYDNAGNISAGTTATATPSAKPYETGKMARNIYPLLPEGWIVNAYTEGTGPYTVNLVVLDAQDQQPVPFADIQGMTANPLLIGSNALVPDLTLVMDEAARTAYILHDSSGQLHLSTVTNIKQKTIAPPPVMQATPTLINFGTVTAGTTKNSTVTVTNTGGSPLHFISITTPSTPFTRISDTCTGVVIAPSGTCSIGIRFAPTVATPYNSSFSITSDGGNATITLQGTGGGIGGI